MKLIKNINYCLNNETAGPNLETLIGIGLSIGIMGYAIVFKNSSYRWVNHIQQKQPSMLGIKTN